MVTIDITIVFHISPQDDTLMKFAFRLGPEGLDGMLQQVQQDSVRAMVRQRKYDEVYDLMNAAHDEALLGTMKELNNSFTDYGVEITAMAVTNVHLPHSIADDMAQTTIYHNQDEYHKLNQQHCLLVIENDEKEKKEKQLMKEKLEQYEAECKKRLAAEHARLGLIKAETKKILSEIREQENADTLKIEADSKLQVSEIDRTKEVQLSQIRAKGAAEGEQFAVEARAYVLKTLAHADASVAKLKGDALTVVAQAENAAVKGLASKRLYDEKMRQLNVIQGLSQNTDVSISGLSKDNTVAQLLASGRGAAILGVNDV
jgi:regulator of protease activity HflC (stomatin/prohibitin superfamily)